MSSESDFLAFKGLKQYTPEDGWGQVNAILQSQGEAVALEHTDELPTPMPSAQVSVQARASQVLNSLNENHESLMPLMDDLLVQLNATPKDDLATVWQGIATECARLSEQMSLQRGLQDKLRQAEQENNALRQHILMRLSEVQAAEVRQLAAARLRMEASALTHAKIAAQLGRV